MHRLSDDEVLYGDSGKVRDGDLCVVLSTQFGILEQVTKFNDAFGFKRGVASGTKDLSATFRLGDTVHYDSVCLGEQVR